MYISLEIDFWCSANTGLDVSDSLPIAALVPSRPRRNLSHDSTTTFRLCSGCLLGRYLTMTFGCSSAMSDYGLQHIGLRYLPGLPTPGRVGGPRTVCGPSSSDSLRSPPFRSRQQSVVNHIPVIVAENIRTTFPASSDGLWLFRYPYV